MTALRDDKESDVKQELLEKPADKADNLRMLLDLNGNVCEVVTGVTVGSSLSAKTLIVVLMAVGS